VIDTVAAALTIERTVAAAAAEWQGCNASVVSPPLSLSLRDSDFDFSGTGKYRDLECDGGSGNLSFNGLLTKLYIF
jgi:hypothetical protein